jgi:hypothetical protein
MQQRFTALQVISIKAIAYTLFIIGLFSFCTTDNNSPLQASSYHTDTIPVALPATFMDDYNVRYRISDSLWIQEPSATYHIIRWNLKEQYIIAKNGYKNPSDTGLYTRIDYMKFNNMEPYRWGFCLSTFDAKSDSLAEFTPTRTDKLNPRKGCNGYPFSRMKKIE